MKITELPATSTTVKRLCPFFMREILGRPEIGSLPYARRSPSANVSWSRSTSGTITRHVLYACLGSSPLRPMKCKWTSPRRVAAYTFGAVCWWVTSKPRAP
jgi:hypothetical protein